MNTHYIATASTGGPEEVETLHSAGIWAVHEHEEIVWDEDGPLRRVEHPVTHTPTGARVPWSPSTKDEAIALADALHAAHPSWGVDAPWGKPPPSAGLEPSIEAICISAMSPRARRSWGA